MSCYNRNGWGNSPWNRPAQGQVQAQAQGQEAEQESRAIFREIGNVNIDIDNENILVADRLER